MTTHAPLESEPLFLLKAMLGEVPTEEMPLHSVYSCTWMLLFNLMLTNHHWFIMYKYRLFVDFTFHRL